MSCHKSYYKYSLLFEMIAIDDKGEGSWPDEVIFMKKRGEEGGFKHKSTTTDGKMERELHCRFVSVKYRFPSHTQHLSVILHNHRKVFYFIFLLK